MTEAAERLLCQLELRQGATVEAITALQESLGTALPSDYLDFLQRSDGGIGHGPDLFVILDRAGDVAATTVWYGAPEHAPGQSYPGATVVATCWAWRRGATILWSWTM